MSPRVPDAYLEARRNEIVMAAAKCFAEKGFHNTTMHDIYETSSLSPGAVYNYFGSKEDIVAAAVEMYQRRNTAIVAEAASGGEGEALGNLGLLFLSLVKQADLGHAASVDLAMYSEANHNNRIREAMRRSHDAIVARVADLVRDAQRAGVFDQRLDAAAISRVLVSIFLGVEIHRALDPDFDMDSYGAVYQALVTRSLHGPGKKRRRHPRIAHQE